MRSTNVVNVAAVVREAVGTRSGIQGFWDQSLTILHR